jgi:hypothetical protein
MKDFTCDTCSTIFQDYPSQRKTKKVFCSTKCKAKWNKTLEGYWAGKKIPFYKRPNRDIGGSKNPRWKGGRRVDKDGYILIWQPPHPNSDYHGYVREHRLVAEKIIGRYLAKEEIVHHIDGNKQNNLAENLEVFANGSEHQKHHYKEGTGSKLKNKKT